MEFTVKGSKFNVNAEFQNFPVTFVNGLRRIGLSEIPVVVLTNIEVLANTTQMPHEMVKHRMEMLPINVNHTEIETIRNAKVELRIKKSDKDQLITTDDFVIEAGREHLIMKDRDLNTPLLFIKVRAGEEIHVRASLNTQLGSQVCTVSTKFHIDPDRAKVDKEVFIKEGGDPKVFDNFYIQKSYSVDDIGRPNWIDMNIESIGVLQSKEILKLAVERLNSEVNKWMDSATILRESEKNVYSITQEGNHTIGALLQEIIYRSKNTEFVSYDIPHPLLKQMVLRFLTSNKPEDVLSDAKKMVNTYCKHVLSSL